MKSVVKFVFLVFALFIIILSSGCSKSVAYSHTESIMGTRVSISVYDSGISRRTIRAAVKDAFGEIERIDLLMSNYKGDSEVSKINGLRGHLDNIKVSDETIEVLRRSQELSQISGGAFDITVLPLMELWGFYSDSGRDKEPTDDEIAKVLRLVGYEKIVIGNNNRVTKSESGVKIDLGGIAKGYAIDRAVQSLKSYGIRAAMIEAGGDFFCLGKKADNDVWKIAIGHPRRRNKPMAVLEVGECAIATSGDYENYNIIGDKRYSHIIDPRSGRPKSDVPASVTVVAEDATSADALATAVFVLGPEEGMGLVERLKGVEAIIISFRDGAMESAISSGLKGRIKLLEQ